MIPPSYLNELSLLQDQIAPFSTKIAFDTIEQELGLPIETLFSEISPEPVAAASLGQVSSFLRHLIDTYRNCKDQISFRGTVISI